MPLALTLMVIFTFCAGGNCRKSSSPTNVLPPETHQGLNTMGCLVNGSLFIPQIPLLDPGNEYYAAYRNLDLILNYEDKPECSITAIGIELDSVQLTQGVTYSLTVQPDSNRQNLHVQWATYSAFPCGALFHLYSTTAQVTGQVTIDYYDSAKAIVAGKFSFDAIDNSNDTVHITEGRFDMALK
jgi:hypothetical protein